jgi:hypothetical protein
LCVDFLATKKNYLLWHRVLKIEVVLVVVALLLFLLPQIQVK